MDKYWNRVLRQRIRRRRALTGAAGLLASAGLLAACGGSDSDGEGAGDKSGLLNVPRDTSSQAKRGGVWINRLLSAADTMEPVAATGSVGFTHTMPVYSKFAKYGKGLDGKLPTTDMITGDAVKSWEVSPDSLSYTLKLREGQKFDPRPPTGGRVFSTEDIRFSMARFEAGSSFRGEVLNKIAPTGMVASMEYPDDSTVIIKLAFPYGPFPDAMAFYPYFNILPREADGGFDPRSEMRGTGPFRLKELQAGIKFVYERNPDWYETGRPFLDGFEQVIIPEYAAALAQFEAGSVWTLDPTSQNIAQEDILSVKQRHPELLLHRNAAMIKAPQFQFFQFSVKPESPFADARLRRAVSMLIDRDAIIDTFYNVPQFRNAGLPIEGLWHSHDFAGQPNWIDPRNKAQDLGEGGRYFQHDVAEARKLVSAAGKEGFTFPFEYQTGAAADQYETIAGMIGGGGFLNPQIKVIDANTHRSYQQSAGTGFDGMWPQTNGGHNEEAWFLNMYNPAGKFTISKEPIPEISDLTLAIRREIDKNKSDQMIEDLQRKLAVQMPNFLLPGYAVGFTLSQPWLKNFGVFVSGDLNPSWSSARIYTEYWYDESAQRRGT
jgi:peptide/nickel transport system substrate-binding protein